MTRNNFTNQFFCLFAFLTLLCCLLPASAIAQINENDSAELDNPAADPRYWMRLGACGNYSLAGIPYEDMIVNLGATPLNEVYPGFTKRLVSCIQKILSGVVDSQLGDLLAYFSDLVTILLTLYIVFFGIKVMLGNVRTIKSDAAVVVLTIAGVSYAVNNAGVEEFLQLFIASQESLVGVVTRSIIQAELPLSGETGVSYNLCSQYTDTWQRIDCVIAYYMGADPAQFAGEPGSFAMATYEFADEGSTSGERKQVTLGFFFIIMGLLFTSNLGIIFLLLGLMIPLLMVAAFAQAITVYIGSLLVLIFLGIMAPLIIPTILFPVTNSIFRFWFQMVLSYIFLPAILMAYLAFMVHILAYFFTAEPRSCVPPATPGDPPDCTSIAQIKPLKEIYKQIYGAYNESSGLATGDPSDQQMNRRTYSGLIESCTALSEDASCEGNTQINTSVGTIWVPDFALDMVGSEEGILHYDYNGNGVLDENELQDLIESKEQASDNFLYNLLVTVLLLALTFGFMANVLAFGGSLAGIAASPVSQALDVYNRTLTRLSAANK